jgi:hypothetical protein
MARFSCSSLTPRVMVLLTRGDNPLLKGRSAPFESGQKPSAGLQVSRVLSPLDASYQPLEQSWWIFSLKKHV